MEESEENIMEELQELGEKVSAIKKEIQEKLAQLESSKGVYEYKKTVLDNKTGTIGALMKQMGKVPKEMKAAVEWWT